MKSQIIQIINYLCYTVTVVVFLNYLFGSSKIKKEIKDDQQKIKEEEKIRYLRISNKEGIKLTELHIPRDKCIQKTQNRIIVEINDIGIIDVQKNYECDGVDLVSITNLSAKYKLLNEYESEMFLIKALSELETE